MNFLSMAAYMKFTPDHLDPGYTPFNWPRAALLPYGNPAFSGAVISAASRLSLSKSVEPHPPAFILLTLTSKVNVASMIA